MLTLYYQDEMLDQVLLFLLNSYDLGECLGTFAGRDRTLAGSGSTSWDPPLE
jgi:hypothetical protein